MFGKVCQGIVAGGFLGMFKVSLLAPSKTTARAKFSARPWFQVHSKNSRDAVGCGANKQQNCRSGASPFQNAGEMGDGIHDHTVAQAQ